MIATLRHGEEVYSGIGEILTSTSTPSTSGHGQQMACLGPGVGGREVTDELLVVYVPAM